MWFMYVPFSFWPKMSFTAILSYRFASTDESLPVAKRYSIDPAGSSLLTLGKNYFENHAMDWDQRNLSRMLTERAKSQSIAMNFKAE
jgi:hypothetical protein